MKLAVMNAIYAIAYIEVEVLNFSGFYIRNCINCVHNCEDHSLLDLTSAVHYMKYLIYHFKYGNLNIVSDPCSQ